MYGTVFKDAGLKDDIEKLDADLWEAADQLRANAKLTSSDYFMRVLGIIFLRHARTATSSPRGRLPPIRRRAAWPSVGRAMPILSVAGHCRCPCAPATTGMRIRLPAPRKTCPRARR
ncbi:MAG TPA: hypothetical protein VFI31_02130 [Pirellulales bacterium]|nr:hypothetical protein [Pirellulales bacterium]